MTKGRILLALLVLVLLSCLVFVFYWKTKQKQSVLLADYIPEEVDWYGQINQVAGWKHFQSIRKDSLFKSTGVWGTFFKDRKSTGIDFVVNPWFFSKNHKVYSLFKISNLTKFKTKLGEIASDSTQFVLADGVEVRAYSFEKEWFSIACNETGQGLIYPKGSDSTSVYYLQPKATSTKRSLNLSGKLAQLKLEKPMVFTLAGIDLIISDSVMNLGMDKDAFWIEQESQNKIKEEGVLKLTMRCTPEAYDSTINSKQLQPLLELVGLPVLNLPESAYVCLAFKDTFHLTTTKVTYEFDDQFNKVELKKVYTKVLPDIKVGYHFESTKALEQFMGNITTKKSLWKKVDNQTIWYGTNWSKPAKPLKAIQGFYYNSRQYAEISKDQSWSSLLRLKKLDGVERIFCQTDDDVHLYFQTKEHPIKWLIKVYSQTR